MPKRTGHLYEKMLDKNLIRYVIMEGSKGKRKRRDVKMVMQDIPKYTGMVYNLIKNDKFTPTSPKEIKIHDKSSGKERIIGVVPFYPDGIIHRLAGEVLKPIFMRGMYAHSCASIPGRGNMHAIKYTKKALADRKHAKHCAKMDIYHYYPSLDPERIITALERKVKDRRMLELVEKIIRSGNQPGLTIGFYINQWLANYYLEPIDHMICTLPGVSYYVRNMDDMVLIGPNKKDLHKAVKSIKQILQAMGLRLKDNWQVFRIDSRGIDFVGYRFFHGYTLLRRRNFLKLTRQSRRIRKKNAERKNILPHEAAGFLSRAGQLEHCSGFHIRRKYVDSAGVSRLKMIVRQAAQEQRECRNDRNDRNNNALRGSRPMQQANGTNPGSHRCAAAA